MFFDDLMGWWQNLRPKSRYQRGFQMAIDEVLHVRMRNYLMHHGDADLRRGYLDALEQMRMGVIAADLERSAYDRPKMATAVAEPKLQYYTGEVQS